MTSTFCIPCEVSREFSVLIDFPSLASFRHGVIESAQWTVPGAAESPKVGIVSYELVDRAVGKVDAMP